MPLYVQGKRWDELSRGQKTLTALSAAAQVLLGLLRLILMITALRDLRQRSADEVRGNRRVWLLAILGHWMGPVAYWLWGRITPES